MAITHLVNSCPPNEKLATQFGVNRSTIVKALDELRSLGWITRKRGGGTQVSEGRWGKPSDPSVLSPLVSI